MLENYGINIYNRDCLEAMKEMPDNAFDLAIVDPPYGLNFGTFNRTNKTSSGERVKADKYKNSNWDNATPTDEYFNELNRVSKHQIIWGGNFFNLPPTKGFIYWYKQNPVPNFSDGEFAWASFDKPNACFAFKYYGNLEGNTTASDKIHPTQKPIDLYKWLLDKYAKEGDKILDTHLGSGSIAIACYEYSFNLTGFELDTDYFNAAKQRVENHIQSHPKLF
jgi:site-specific DNA-methyltransferase (adenine-specific)